MPSGRCFHRGARAHWQRAHRESRLLAPVRDGPLSSLAVPSCTSPPFWCSRHRRCGGKGSLEFSGCRVTCPFRRGRQERESCGRAVDREHVMTSQKSFKLRVRTRMDKTGESYTTARRNLLKRVEPPPAAAPATTAIMTQRLSDASLRERSGRGWDEWFALLDAWGATEHTHTEIARWLVAEHQVDNWSAQSVTGGYEQVRGMRAPGQQSNGDFVASVSRTVAMPVDRLFDAFAVAASPRRQRRDTPRGSWTQARLSGLLGRDGHDRAAAGQCRYAGLAGRGRALAWRG